MDGPNDDCRLLEDNIYEILTRVALSSLPSCLRVCKSWRRIAYEPCFDASHSFRTATTSGFILQTIRHHKYHHTFLSIHSSSNHPLPISSLLPCRSQTLHIEATAPTHGLLLCIRPESSRNNDIIPRYYITRLSTTPHHHLIPNPKTRFFTFGIALVFGVDHNINRTFNDFKIVRISKPRWSWTAKAAHLICEVFDSVARRWRRSNDLPYLMLRGKTGLVIKQTAYWMVSEHVADIDGQGFSSCSVFAFNVDEERGRIIRGPEATLITPNMPWEWRMVPCEERLCLVYMLNEDIKVWMMMVEVAGENIQRWEWMGSFSKQYIKNHKFAFEDDIWDQKVVLLETLYRELWYDLRGREFVDTMNPPQSVFRMYLDCCS